MNFYKESSLDQETTRLDRMREQLKQNYLIYLEEHLESGAVTDPVQLTKYKHMKQMLKGEIK